MQTGARSILEAMSEPRTDGQTGTTGAAGAGLYAYVRPMPAEDPPLDEALQRTAVRACALGERLGAPEIFEEGATEGRAAYGHLARLVHETPAGVGQPTVILATLRVLGDSALERARRLLHLEAQGARVILADGISSEDALLQDWEQRPDSERRRDRAREAMRSKALRGLVLGRPPYGYQVEDRMLVPHPRESQVVKRMFHEYLEDGEGLRRIAAGLNRDGIRTHLGRTWTPGSVRTVLRNPAYTGLYRRLGVAVAAAHPALIDRASFHAVQRRMTARRTSRLEQQRHEYLLAGLLRCGRCASPMIGERRRAESGVVVAYRCEAATAQGRCKERGHREEVLLAAVREELGEATRQHPVAARPGPRPDSVLRRRRLERRLTEAVERWIAGEWRYYELVRRVASVARDLQEEEDPPVQDSPAAEEARRRLLQAWDGLDPEAHRTLLRAAVAEVVVADKDVRIALRR